MVIEPRYDVPQLHKGKSTRVDAELGELLVAGGLADEVTPSPDAAKEGTAAKAEADLTAWKEHQLRKPEAQE